MGDRVGVQILVWEIYLGLTNHPDQLSLAIPPWLSAMSTGQRALMLCGWEVKAAMARVWWQVKLCEPLQNTSYPSASGTEAELVRLSPIQTHGWIFLLTPHFDRILCLNHNLQRYCTSLLSWLTQSCICLVPGARDQPNIVAEPHKWDHKVHQRVDYNSRYWHEDAFTLCPVYGWNSEPCC